MTFWTPTTTSPESNFNGHRFSLMFPQYNFWIGNTCDNVKILTCGQNILFHRLIISDRALNKLDHKYILSYGFYILVISSFMSVLLC